MNNQSAFVNWLAIGVILAGIVAVIVLTLQPPATEIEPLPTRAAAMPTDTPTPTSTPMPTATPVPIIALPTPTSTPAVDNLPVIDPPPGGQVYRLLPAHAGVVGWTRAVDTAPNHLGDYNIYAGIYEDNVHLGAMQFDLSEIPPGAPVLHADLTLLGLSDEFLGPDGNWTVDLLASWMNQDWGQLDYPHLARAYNVATSLVPPLSKADLGRGQPNTLFFPPDALALLEAELYQGTVAFRVAGPSLGEDNLFAWDSGFGAGSLASPPLLRVVTGPMPDAPPPSPTPNYVIITPETENLVERAAAVLTATAQATPYTGEGTPTPTPTATPYPPNWVTPVILTNTPVPENAATAEWQSMVATAQAIVLGTPTPFPVNMWTATPTPGPTATRDLIPVGDLTATPTPTATPGEIPPVLRGRILFLSNRFGNADGDLLVMDADGSNVAIWAAGSDAWVYRQARVGQDLAPDGRGQVLVSDRQINTVAQNLLDNPHLFVVSSDSDVLPLRITQQGMNYDAAWSPVDYRIAYVSTEPGNDEIFTVRPDGNDRQRLTFNEW
ncbi:MAG: hypothetical protein WDZ49_04215, partial [Litorilinea sp.]